MCGIIGYIGDKNISPILLQGLRRLEYRGYDSSGIACLQKDGTIKRIRSVGKIEDLENKVRDNDFDGVVGIAHTRWATHGEVVEENAHPHFAMNGKLALVHNGIIENYRELKKYLRDVDFSSQTDSEVLAHLIARFYQGSLRQAVNSALEKVRGTYGIVVMHKDHPDHLVVARMGSPLVVGMGSGGYYVASDTTPILAHTNKVVFLNDGEIANVYKNRMQTFNLKYEQVVKCIEQIDWNEEQAEKQGYEHFMLKEIFEQPIVFKDAIRGRVNLEDGTAHLGGLNMTESEMHDITRIILIACGTASYAATVGKYAFEKLAGIPTSVEVASEFRYSDPIIDRNTLVFGISQSGETADTLAALREAKRKGAYVRGIINVVGSTIARETDGGTYIHAGPELAVASTKAYTNMVAILLLYALEFGRSKRVTVSTGQKITKALLEIPEKMYKALEQNDYIKQIAYKYKDYNNCFFLGRGINYPVAREGALKLKEISYIHSESYPGGEMKHGPIALLSKDFLVVAIMTRNQLYDKMRSNIEEVKARKSKILLVATEGDERAKELADDVIYVPSTLDLLEPLLNTIPLQILAYHVAVLLGKDVDRPRNLAKSVTVE
jgi:glucosamine--fructose-6-phosphate aminotransferase (isomerizing)